ncbi:lipopolysaccharide biosynthesis protein [Sphingomonas alba]|uniref:Lipopolysaccharide biosynthesis protein n=1 Tax=Sphingomonas alba TaxID=2908208 RepID=A0ABT0RJE3_9SPHN|nr:lipopolysaccharide biosynthesis protein [Sphingomonas alba]MCL6682702.1 lipopolysaccharide biosynthesis protein [Sphingomonas alba]
MTRRGVLGASAWSGIDVVGRQATAFVFSIALARILGPADFGTAALAIMCSAIIVALVQTGLVTWLVSRAETGHDEENAAFWLCLLVSSALAASLAALAPALAAFFAVPILEPLIWAAAAQIVFAALGAVQTGLLTRALAMRKLTVAGIVSGLVSGGLSVAMALSGRGAISIVTGLAVNALVNTVILWLLCHWRPGLPRALGAIRPHWHFLRNLGASNLLEGIYGNISNALLGKFQGAHELGLYNRAFGTQQLPGNIIAMAATRVMLPVFVDSREHPERLRKDVAAAVQVLMMISLPAMAVLAATSDLVIETLFGAKWLPAAPLLSILAIGGALLPLHIVNLQFMLAQDRSDEYLRVETIKKVLGIGLLSVGSLGGIYGVAMAQAAYSVLALPINTGLAKKTMGYGALKQLIDLAPAAAAAALMGLSALFLKRELQLQAPAELTVILAACAALFLTLVAASGPWLEGRGHINLLSIVREARSRAPHA